MHTAYVAGSWNQAGGIAHHGFAGMFWKAIPKDRWPEDQETLDFMMKNGLNHLVTCVKISFYRSRFRKEKIVKLLDDCY